MRDPSGERGLRLVLAEDHELVAQGLQAMLAAHEPPLVLVGTVGDDDELVALVERSRPDIVLLDGSLRPEMGRAVTARLLACQDPPRVVLYTLEEDDRGVVDVLRWGARGYLLKSSGGRHLVDGLRRVAAGEVVVDPALATRVALGTADRARNPDGRLGLTPREQDVLTSLVEGHTNQEIATALRVSTETVKAHLQSLYRKLGVRRRTAAVAAAHRHGLVPRTDTPPVPPTGDMGRDG